MVNGSSLTPAGELAMLQMINDTNDGSLQNNSQQAMKYLARSTFLLMPNIFSAAMDECLRGRNTFVALMLLSRYKPLAPLDLMGLTQARFFHPRKLSQSNL